MNEVQKIKKLLPKMVSADIELIIVEATRQLRINSFKEADRFIRQSLDPKTIELLKEQIKLWKSSV